MAPPRIAALGRHITALGNGNSGLVDALAGTCDLRTYEARTGAGRWLQALTEGARAVGRDGCDVVHALDPSLAAGALLLRARYGVPAAITLDALPSARTAPGGLSLIGRFDQVFVSDLDRARDLALRLTRPAVAYTPLGIGAAAEPAERSLKAYRRMLRGVDAGRLIVGMLWPSDREHLRWFRDAVAPLLHSEPICLLIGAPNSREPRHLFGSRAMKRIRTRAVRLSPGEIAAAARFADVFVVPGTIKRARSQPEALLTLAASGVPIVAGGAVRDDVLAHERNALLVDPGDAMGLASTLNKLLMLPATQRHFLGEDFARYTLVTFTWARAADVYSERFSMLVGRPRIPQELKAA